MTERELLRLQWRGVSDALAIEFVAPFQLTLADGSTKEFAFLLPQFGGGRGMLVDSEYEKNAFSTAIAQGFTCSSMSVEHHHLPVDPANYVGCLTDWGWCSECQAPSWYTDAV